MGNRTVLPEGWRRPKGYSNAVVAQGRQIYVAGQVGWDSEERFNSDDIVEQATQALRNVVAVLEAAGAGPEHIVRMTWYVTLTSPGSRALVKLIEKLSVGIFPP